MSAISDQELLHRYVQTRDDADFRPLVVRYAALVHRACLARLRRHDLADDATQAVFILLAEKAGRIRASATLTPWLLSTARFASLRIARAERQRARREAPLDESVPSGEEALDGEVVSALERMRGGERDAIVLSVLHGLSYVEVGERLGITEDAARMRVKRGLERLRTNLESVTALSPAFLDRLSAPSQASSQVPERLRLSHHWRYSPLNYGYLLAPAGLILLFVGLVPRLRESSEPAPTPASIPRQAAPPVAQEPRSGSRSPKVPVRQGGIQFHFEDYFGKSPAWFEQRFGPAEPSVGFGGGTGKRGGPLRWRTYERRSELGGGMGRMASASYTFTEGFNGQVLAISFDGPVGAEPEATHIAHGIQPKPRRTLDQEAKYIGISMSDYREISYDPSYPEGTRRFLKKNDPKIMLVVTFLNDTCQMELDQNYP